MIQAEKKSEKTIVVKSVSLSLAQLATAFISAVMQAAYGTRPFVVIRCPQ